jgi:membrane fusion protein (multidrug efflux system)
MPVNYRREALEHANQHRLEGEILRSTPLATRAAYRLVVAACVFALGFLAIGRMQRYAVGPMVIRVDGRTEVSALNGGTIAETAVHPGEMVRAGDLLVRFRGDAEEAELRRLRREYEDRARARLRDLNDEMSRTALISLRAELSLAERKLAEESIRAPCAGTVGDVRVRPGQVIPQGTALLTLATAATRARVVAMLPAHDRPMLHAGGPLRVELRGYPYAYRQATIELVGDEALGPREVQRYLGDELADTVELRGPVVLVEATLPSPSFHVDGQVLRYVDGMSGQAEASLRSEPLATLLMPALRLLRGARQ